MSCTRLRSGVTDGSSKLAASIAEVEQLRKRRKQWPPVNSGEDRYRNGLRGVMDEEMGWEG